MSSTSQAKVPKPSKSAKNSAARLLAVQAVYQMLGSENKDSPDDLIKEFLAHRAGMEIDGETMVPPNEEHFVGVVRGVSEHSEQLIDMVAQNRRLGVEEGKTATLEPLLKAILLCGAFELMVLQDIDAPLIIAEYMKVSHAFYEDGEAKMVNAVLDSVRKTVR
ncbi:MAG: transcription antitermination protein NusB [Alphaproteobacteria bacterium]|nr:transcription antitermination protein NusB [Alphaproteobacteria bacterium]